MKKRGFTLVELLAVLVLIAAISLIVFPSIINYINSTKGDISKATKELIISSTKLYVSDNAKTFPQYEGYSYCTTLETLADKNYIDKPFVDSSTGKELDLSNTYVKVSYVYDYDLGTTKYTYDVVDTCTAGIADNYELVTTSGSIANLDNKEVVDYKVYGNDTGISSLNLKTVGNNLLSTDDWYEFYKTNTTLTNTSSLTNNTIEDGYNVITWIPAVGHNSSIKDYIYYPLSLDPSTQYTIKYRCKMAALNTTKSGAQSTGFGFLYSTKEKTTLYCDDSTEWNEKELTSTSGKQIIGLFMPYYYGLKIIVDKDSVVLKEKSAEDEPYKELKEEVTLPSSLSSNDFIEYKTQTLVKSDGTMQKINLPKIKTYDGISNIIINDGTTNYPAKIELLVRNKNKA